MSLRSKKVVHSWACPWVGKQGSYWAPRCLHFFCNDGGSKSSSEREHVLNFLQTSHEEHFRDDGIPSKDIIPKSGTSGKCLKHSRIDSSSLGWLDNHPGKSPEGLWCSWLSKSPRLQKIKLLCALFLKGERKKISCRISSWNSQSKALMDWLFLSSEFTCWGALEEPKMFNSSHEKKSHLKW